MAVLLGGGSAVRVAYNQKDDNAADRLLALQAQVGLVETFVGDLGTVLRRKIGFEIMDVDVGLNIFDDGQTYGGSDMRLTSASNPFTATMVGLQMTIIGHGQRYIEVYNGPGDIEYGGAVIDADTGLQFTQPLGTASFEDGQVSGNTITSVSAPFYAGLVGRNIHVDGLGSREISAYTSTSEIDFGGSAEPFRDGVLFTIPVILATADRQLIAGSQVIDSHRSPPLIMPTTMRWRLGERRERGTKRVVV